MIREVRGKSLLCGDSFSVLLAVAVDLFFCLCAYAGFMCE